MNLYATQAYRWVILLSVLTVLLCLLLPELATQLELPIFVVLIVLTGIPHGATDHIIYRQNQQARGRRYSFPRFLAYYFLGMIGYSICWIWFPKVSLLIFLLISAYHFGQSQLLSLQLSERHPFKVFAYLLWGAWVLAVLILGNFEESAVILAGIFPNDGQWLGAVQTLQTELVWGLSVATVATILWAGKKDWLSVKQVAWELCSLGLLILLAQFGGLLLSFAIYFGLWHGLRSIEIEIKALQQQNPQYSWRTFVKDALPYSLLSFVGMLLLIGLMQGLLPDVSPYLIFFILISVLTLPHFLHMRDFYALIVQPKSTSRSV